MSNILACYELLELNVISAQDLAPVGRSMRTYAVAWIDPDRKLSTKVDSDGGTNPSWNDKFVFRVDEDFIYEDSSTITIDIYAIHWFRDIHVGTAQVLTGDLIMSLSQPYRNNTYKQNNMHFVGLQVLRPSGRPQGILNIGVAVIDSSTRSMPLYTHHNTQAVGSHHDHHNHQAEPELRRTKSDTSSVIASEVVAHERKRAKANKSDASSEITPSEASTRSMKKVTPRKGKFGKKRKKMMDNASPREFNARATPRVNAGYEVKPSPKPQFQNSPNPTRGYNSNYNGGVRATPMHGKVRATPMHAFAMRNAALEYGTPFRSNMGRALIMTDSELGPSASEVAAVVARQPVVEEENSTVGGWSLDDDSVEEMQPKVERWQAELPPVYDGGKRSTLTLSSKKGKHPRRHPDGGNGLFSCFSVICGVECSIVCGGDNKKNRRRRSQSVDNTSFL